MAIYGKYFEYNGKSSKDFGLMIASFSGFDEDIPMGVSRNLERGEITKYRYKPNHFGTLYTDTLQFVLKLVKDPCLTGYDNTEFSRSEIREINAWLTSSHFPTLFHMTDYDKPDIYDEYIDYFGTFTEVTAFAQSSILELNYTFINDSPFGYSAEISHTITSTSSTAGKLTINCTTDEREDYVCPQLIITPGWTGEISISNKTDGGTITISALKDDKIYIDSERLSIYDETKSLITFEDLGIGDIGEIYWFHLLYGTNEIEVTGDATVEIIYREPRKVGAY